MLLDFPRTEPRFALLGRPLEGFVRRRIGRTELARRDQAVGRRIDNAPRVGLAHDAFDHPPARGRGNLTRDDAAAVLGITTDDLRELSIAPVHAELEHLALAAAPFEPTQVVHANVLVRTFALTVAAKHPRFYRVHAVEMFLGRLILGRPGPAARMRRREHDAARLGPIRQRAPGELRRVAQNAHHRRAFVRRLVDLRQILPILLFRRRTLAKRSFANATPVLTVMITFEMHVEMDAGEGGRLDRSPDASPLHLAPLSVPHARQVKERVRVSARDVGGPDRTLHDAEPADFSAPPEERARKSALGCAERFEVFVLDLARTALVESTHERQEGVARAARAVILAAQVDTGFHVRPDILLDELGEQDTLFLAIPRHLLPALRRERAALLLHRRNAVALLFRAHFPRFERLDERRLEPLEDVPDERLLLALRGLLIDGLEAFPNHREREAAELDFPFLLVSVKELVEPEAAHGFEKLGQVIAEPIAIDAEVRNAVFVLLRKLREKVDGVDREDAFLVVDLRHDLAVRATRGHVPIDVTSVVERDAFAVDGERATSRHRLHTLLGPLARGPLFLGAGGLLLRPVPSDGEPGLLSALGCLLAGGDGSLVFGHGSTHRFVREVGLGELRLGFERAFRLGNHGHRTHEIGMLVDTDPGARADGNTAEPAFALRGQLVPEPLDVRVEELQKGFGLWALGFGLGLRVSRSG